MKARLSVRTSGNGFRPEAADFPRSNVTWLIGLAGTLSGAARSPYSAVVVLRAYNVLYVALSAAPRLQNALHARVSIVSESWYISDFYS